MAPKYAPDGKFFKLKGEECGIYLTLQDECTDPGTPVVIWEDFDPDSDSQYWYEDQATGTVRCKKGHLCLTKNDDGSIVVDEFRNGHDSQKFRFDEGSRVVSTWTGDLVLDVVDHNTVGGSPVYALPPSGEANQRWTFKRTHNEYFMLISRMSGMCIEAEAKMMGGIKSGSKVVVGPKDRKDNQMWYEDINGIIRSKVDGMGLICDKEQGAQLRVEDYDESNPDMQWVYLPKKHVVATKNLLTNVLDIEGQSRSKGAKVIVWQAMGSENQLWDIEYYTKGKKTKKGASAEADSDSD